MDGVLVEYILNIVIYVYKRLNIKLSGWMDGWIHEKFKYPATDKEHDPGTNIEPQIGLPKNP